ncbi:MAG: hypothetical protein WBF08_10200 [Candidatus Bathyarchaeia archaeon]
MNQQISLGFPFPGLPPPSFPQRPRAIKGFGIALLAGILTMLAGIAATILALLFPANVPGWLAPYIWGGVIIGVLLGILIILGAFLIWVRYWALGGIFVFLCSLANVYLVMVWFITVPWWPWIIMGVGLFALIIGAIAGVLGISGK